MGCRRLSGGDLLCLLALLLGFCLSSCRTRTYTNHWAVRITGGSQEANRIANKYGYINMGQIGTLKDYYHFYHSRTIKRSVLSSRGSHSFISMEPKVEWIQQQVVKRRTKRDYKAGISSFMFFNDPKWPSMWYMHCSDNVHRCQSDMNIVGAWRRGYTGKNVVVTILDDGIERTHPDLMQNYDSQASFDVNSDDFDPMPRYDASNENKHGTRCAGEVAATANNSHCTVGIAFNAKIGGVRMLDGEVTDMVEAKSLSLNPQHIHIYSASWGPDDDGKTVDGPGSLARLAFEDGIRTGRRGLGSVYVWASGNGGRSRDHCSCDGYTNSIYTISISSTAESGRKPWYLEECASTMATTYSSGESYDRKIVTTDLRQRCTDSHTGTSASAPMAAGIIALALEANPFLTWRDVQHIIVRTSRARHLSASDWKTNAAGYKVSHLYGFGLMDAEAVVIEAEKWTTVPVQHTCVENTDRQIKTIRPDNAVRSVYKATGCADNSNHHVIYLEHVVVRVTITHPRRGDLAIYLTSPSGTRSQLLANRLFDHFMEGFKNWEFMTTHCWGEKASGDWILEIFDTPSQLRNFKTPGKLKEWSLVLYGTSIQPYSPRNDLPKVERVRSSPVEEPSEDYSMDDYTGPCDTECSNLGCYGPGPHHCNDCMHMHYRLKNNTRICVPECPPGHYNADKKRCKKCSVNCELCVGSRSDQCTACKSGYYLNEETNVCVTNCPDGFYLENQNLCRKCSENCKTCSSDHTCTECRHGLSLQGSMCVVSCENGTFYNSYKKECDPCHRTCATCSGAGADACINCTSVYLMEEGRCVVTCSTGYYFDQTLENGYKICRKCDASCLKCGGPGEKNCTSCPNGYILEAGVCLAGTVCRDGEFINDSGDCQFCDASCLKCTGPSESDCVGCAITKFFDEGHCVLTCPKGKYQFKNQCHICHHTCKECSGSEPSKCTACGTGKNGSKRFLFNGECRQSCPKGHYSSSGKNACLPCLQNCEVCSGPTECARCVEGYYPASGSCQKLHCGEGEVEDIYDEECVPCAAGCQSCYTSDPGTCLACVDGYYMFHKRCYASCPEKTYRSDVDKLCIECGDTCRSCSSTECKWCEEGFYLLDGECVSDCGSGYYKEEDEGECGLCHRTCTMCSGPEYDECTVCSGHLQLRDRKCEDPSKVAIEGWFWNANNVTKEPCDESCKTCNGSDTTCTSCPSGSYLSASECVTSCPRGSFASEHNKRCEQCVDGCEVCSEHKRRCLKCMSRPDQQLYLHNEECLKECPDGYFADGSACSECSSPCEICDGRATFCLSCQSSFLLEQNECKVSCSERHTAVDGVCRHCPANCRDCVSGETCTDCSPDFFLYNNQCVRDCPAGFYADFQQCSPCHHQCAECDGPDSDDCLKCTSSSFVLYDGECFRDCPEGTYYEQETADCQECDQTCRTCSSPKSCITCKKGLVKNSQDQCVAHKDCALTEYLNENGVCLSCHKKCARCMGPSEQQCLGCPANHYILNGTCLETCPAGYFTEKDENRCSACHSTCETCLGKHNNQCLSCKVNWYKLEHTCSQTCLTGFYADNSSGRCERCHKSCRDCLGPLSTDCLSCHRDFFLMSSRRECIHTCPEHYFQDEIYKTCKRCHPTCNSCNGKGATSCTSCVWSYHLSGGICNSDCLIGDYKVQEEPELKCDKCHDLCTECKGPGPLNCTACSANQLLYVEESRCVQCCGMDPMELPECCDCTETLDECLLKTGRLVPSESKGKTAIFIATSILLILSIGAAIFFWKRSRSKAKSTSKVRYEKLLDQAKVFPSYMASRESFEQDQVIEFRDRDEEEDEEEEDYDDDDIVYMGQDGTIYRKFKYGLLDDEDDELEYDDESYSYR
uniref:Proprotein convertase subtilisin/kexin type 5 isoform X1 n=1 Tax=Geotrypetes seraphini TaxID=260995 RepID=A0A6P8P1G8_GEOSA|nr:proprotein convertase subtilisin/kexin type 5 isoform X1 [Geotrypetes seraphini]